MFLNFEESNDILLDYFLSHHIFQPFAMETSCSLLRNLTI